MPKAKTTIDVVLKKRSRVIVENGGSIWFDQTLPAGSHEIKIDEIIPGATGKSTISVNGRTIAEIDHK